VVVRKHRNTFLAVVVVLALALAGTVAYAVKSLIAACATRAPI
jgi:hypothetical protein